MRVYLFEGPRLLMVNVRDTEQAWIVDIYYMIDNSAFLTTSARHAASPPFTFVNSNFSNDRMGTTNIQPGSQKQSVKIGPGASVAQQQSGGCC